VQGLQPTTVRRRPSDRLSTEQPYFRQSSLFSMQALCINMDWNQVVNGEIDVTEQIQRGIDNGGLNLPAGCFMIAGTLQIRGGSKLSGVPGETALKKTGRGHLMDGFGEDVKHGINIQGITFDSNNVDTGLAVEFVQNMEVKNCVFKNHPWWGISLGIIDSHSSTIANRNVLFQDCNFENTSQTYEHLLIFNSESVKVQNCSFKIGSKAHAIGIWQHASDILIQDCTFQEMNGGIYYSLSTNKITIKECTYTRLFRSITGANISDRGSFDYECVEGLAIENCSFTEATGPCIVLGGVHGVNVSNCNFEDNGAECIAITPNQTTYKFPSKNVTISACSFKNNNTQGLGSVNGACLKFEAGPATGVKVECCEFQDTNANPKQVCPVAFKSFAFDDIVFDRCDMQSYNGHLAISVAGATLGPNVKHINCQGKFD